MLILAVHTSSPFLGVAVTKGGEIVVEEILAPGKEHLENLTGAITKVMSEAGLELGDLDGLAVAIGPGSFSGIRVGLSVVKGLAMALNVHIVGVSSLEILACQSVKKGRMAIPLINAGRGEFYSGIFKKHEDSIEIIRPPRLLSKGDVAGFISDVCSLETTICGTPDIIGAITRETAISGKAVTTPSPGTCGILAEKRMILEAYDDIHGLTPLYIRRSDAEANRRA